MEKVFDGRLIRPTDGPAAELSAQAAVEGSENGSLGVWSSARLDVRPDAGALTVVGGRLYVAVAGRSREGYRGDVGGLYSRWVQVPVDHPAHGQMVGG